MKIFRQNYVGINHKRKDITLAPLAFLVPYEDNAAGRKRIESVDSWLNYTAYYLDNKLAMPSETRIIDNVAKSGFKVVDVASRDMTSNKFARIYDPDGFELEISIGNLIDLMLYTIVDHGVIEGELIWARDGAHNRLIPVDSELYRNALQEGQVLAAQVGDIVVGNHNRRYVYFGQGYVQPVAICGDEIVTQNNYSGGWGGWRWHQQNRYSINPKFIGTATAEQSKHVYLTLNDEQAPGNIETRNSAMKITANLGPSGWTVDPLKVYYADRGYWCSADGRFQGFREINGNSKDIYHHHTRFCMVRDRPFVSSDIDFESILAQINELN
jgi:hypothetical protein